MARSETRHMWQGPKLGFRTSAVDVEGWASGSKAGAPSDKLEMDGQSMCCLKWEGGVVRAD